VERSASARWPGPGALSSGRRGAFLIVNEEGKLSGLPVNVFASAVFGWSDVILGDVVLVPPRQMAV
jgi:hypothetical protein